MTWRKGYWFIAALALLTSCQEPPSAIPPIDATPRLLHDTEEIAAYVQAFPFDAHGRYHMPSRCLRGQRFFADSFAKRSGERLFSAERSRTTLFFACWWQRFRYPYVGEFWIEEPPEDLIKLVHVAGLVWEPRVIAALETHLKPGAVAVDVGAYIGTHALLMGRLVGPTGRVYAFEPQRKNYRELHHNVALNDLDQVVPLRYALGAETRVVEMNPTTPAMESGLGIGSGGEQVELRALDSFGFEQVALLKIDVEGFEKEVLAGAVELLRTSRPVILIEILGGAFYPGVPETACCGKPATAEQIEEVHAMWRLIENHGYTVEPLESHNYIALPVE